MTVLDDYIEYKVKNYEGGHLCLPRVLNACPSSIKDIISSNGSIHNLYGDDIFEEFLIYTGQFNNFSRHFYISSAIYMDGNSVLEGIGNSFEKNIRSRLYSFLNRGISGLSHNGKRITLKLILELSRDDLINVVLNIFLSSRMKPVDVDLARESIIRAIDILTGDVFVAYSGYSGVNLFTALAAWGVLHSREDKKIVILSDNKINSNVFESVRQRNYVSKKSVSHFLSNNSDVAYSEALFVRAQKGYGYNRNLYPNEFGIRTSCGLIESYYDTAVEDNGGADEEFSSPPQKPALVRFKSHNGLIDLLNDNSSDPNSALITGGVEAVYGIYEDIISSSSIGNVVPAFMRKMNRIGTVLNDIRNGDFGDNDVVRLGVEVESLSDFANIYSLEISSSSMKELASFVARCIAYISQFRIWSEYKTNEYINLGSSSKLIADQLILSASNEPNMFSPEAKIAVEEVVDVVDDNLFFVSSAKSTMAVAENMVAQASEIVNLGENKEVSDWAKRNASEIDRLGQAASVGWLSVFAKLVAGKP